MSLVNLKQVLKDTRNSKYAVGAFNFNNFEDAQGIVDGACAKKSPVILMASMSAVKYLGLKQTVAMIKAMAESCDIPICLHLDHCTSVDLCKQAVVAGFSSVMIDASSLSYEENVKMTKEVVEFAHKYGVSVEAEIGHVGGVEDDINVGEDEAFLTKPKDAKKFVEDTNVDALAIAIGTVHGFYKKKPNIDFQRLKEIRNLVDVFLVLHGGTGVSAEDFKKCIEDGMSKINVGTELKNAFSLTLRKQCKEVDEKEIDPRKIIKKVRDVSSEIVQEKIEIFGSKDKA